MRNSISFTDYINDSVRLLIILETVGRLKPSIKVTESKIKLYDFYLKFPCTMLAELSVRNEAKANFDEFYAFFHWKPDVVRYRSNLNYLIAKGLIEKRVDGNDLFFVVCPQGVDALTKMKSGFKQRLVELAAIAVPVVSKLSDKKVEEAIADRRYAIAQNWRGQL